MRAIRAANTKEFRHVSEILLSVGANLTPIFIVKDFQTYLQNEHLDIYYLNPTVNILLRGIVYLSIHSLNQLVY